MLILLLAWALGTVFTWVLVVVTLLVFRKIIDVGFASLGDLLWRSAVVAATVNVALVFVEPVNWLLAMIVGLIVFVGMLMKMFDMDLWQGAVAVIAVSVVRFVLMGAIGTLIALN